MKIGLVLDRFEPETASVARWVAGFARFLEAGGHEARILAFAAAPGSAVELLGRGATVLARGRAAADGVARLGLDAVLDTGTGGGGVFMPWTGSRRLARQRLLARRGRLQRVRTAVSPASRAVDLSLARLEGRQVREAKQVVAVSPVVRDVLVRQHGIDPAKVSVIPVGAELARFAPARLSALRQEGRATLGVGDGVLFVAAADDPWLAGFDTAINALDLLVYEEADVHLALAGFVPDADWRRMAQASAGRVHFLGAAGDMAPWFASADALVHPARWDACAMAVTEAAASGLAAVTTTRDGAAALVADGESGFVLEAPDDIGTLADRMRRLLDPAVRARMGDAARPRAPDAGANYRAVLEALIAAR